MAKSEEQNSGFGTSRACTIVWAVTSANHQNTKRNPVSYDRREAAIERFSVQEGLRSLVVPVFDTAQTDRFAEVTLKSVESVLGHRPTPADTVVACSTPEVAALYSALGFTIAPVEADAAFLDPALEPDLVRAASGDNGPAAAISAPGVEAITTTAPGAGALTPPATGLGAATTPATGLGTGTTPATGLGTGTTAATGLGAATISALGAGSATSRLGAVTSAPGPAGTAPERPWDVLLRLATGDPSWRELAHPATVDVYDRYRLDEQVALVVNDPVVGEEGGLTTTRDYRTYAEAFEASAERKWDLVKRHVRPGRIVDVGCGAGAVLALADREPALRESDLIGVEVARHLFEECVHRKAQGWFTNPNVYFYCRNVLGGAVFPPRSIDTTLTFALTHEIWSYGDRMTSLRAFAEAIYEHTVPGGVWINSDVCGPDNRALRVRLSLQGSPSTPATAGGESGAPRPAGNSGAPGPAGNSGAPGPASASPAPLASLDGLTRDEIAAHVEALPTRARLDRFAADFHFPLPYADLADPADPGAVEIALSDAMEFLTHKDYPDNWLSEAHEQFCGLEFADWKALLTDVGFEVDPASHSWRNDWIVEHRIRPYAQLSTLDGRPLGWPDTHVLLVARRPLNT
ncbi:class I SAM-dependent methyltransferase [Dactylosporangium sp. McL0621]|uniref:class I SAM-dependent methyltransferase n=1 Tax=Dactylosporangium sp. McL0621 TaxID=3415678 RepID=UPI003CF3A12D